MIKRLLVVLVVLALCTPGWSEKLTDKKDLPMADLVSVLAKSQKATVAGLKMIRCDYRGESDGKPMIRGTLTLDLTSLPGLEAEFEGLANWVWITLPTMRLDIKDWPASRGHIPPGSPDWNRLCSNSNTIWFVSRDGKAKKEFGMSEALGKLILGGMPPYLRYSYLAAALATDDPGLTDPGRITGHSTATDKIGGRTCVVYVFDLKRGPDDRPDGYKVWLDSEWQMPLREETLRKGNIKEWQTFADYVQLSSGALGARHYSGSFGSSDIVMEEDFSRFGSHCLLPKEFRMKSPANEKAQKVQFSNWRKVTVPPSFFSVPTKSKEIK